MLWQDILIRNFWCLNSELLHMHTKTSKSQLDITLHSENSTPLGSYCYKWDTFFKGALFFFFTVFNLFFWPPPHAIFFPFRLHQDLKWNSPTIKCYESVKEAIILPEGGLSVCGGTRIFWDVQRGGTSLFTFDLQRGEPEKYTVKIHNESWRFAYIKMMHCIWKHEILCVKTAFESRSKTGHEKWSNSRSEMWSLHSTPESCRINIIWIAVSHTKLLLLYPT